MERPPITLLMPLRNGMPYLPETLATIQKQTHSKYRLLIWDNGSTDGSIEELRRWIPEKIPGEVVTGKPMRLGPSQKALVEMAQTELCARVDGDDLNHPDRLQKQIDFMLEHPEVGVVGNAVEVIDEHGHEKGKKNYPVSDAEARWSARWAAPVAHPTVMYRRSVVLAAGNYRDVKYEDAELWVRVARNAAIQNLPEKLLSYRRHSSSYTGALVDWVQVRRTFAQDAGEYLFPGIKSARRMELWDVSYPERVHLREHRVRLWHIRSLRRAALTLAQQTGKPSEYFTGTEPYRTQIYWLRRRLLEQWGFGKLRELAARLKHA